jgi:hypothetical protein
MRLLNAQTLELSTHDEDLALSTRPIYAALSHTWGDEEVSFQDWDRPDRDKMKGFRKILGCCEQARKDGIEWVWVDTCCIDKRNSAELSEAINSMFLLYWYSEVCYVFLEDVLPWKGLGAPEEQLRKARWFTRGWCLQELIAPMKLEFYANDWSEIGTKWSLANLISDITHIPGQALVTRKVDEYSAVQKMSWAAKRKTKKLEDEAYCLLGLFGIQMPLLYGEGRLAFVRLQTEIILKTEDYSLLLWTADDAAGLDQQSFSALSPSPSLFHPLGPMLSTGERCDYREMRRPSAATAREIIHPPQLIGRGLSTHLRTHHEYDEAKGAWGQTYLSTFWTFRDKFLSIQMRVEPSGFSWDREMIHHIYAVERPKQWGNDRPCLSTVGRLYNLHSPPPVIPQQQDLEIILSSKCSGGLVLAETSPPLPSRTVTDLSSSRVYFSNIDPALSRYTSNRGYWPFSFTFGIYTSPQDPQASFYAVINFWPELDSPRCCIWLPDTGLLDRIKSGEDDAWFSYKSYDYVTDRHSIKPYPDCPYIVRVSAKSRRRLAKGYIAATGSPAHFSVYVTLHDFVEKTP